MRDEGESLHAHLVQNDTLFFFSIACRIVPVWNEPENKESNRMQNPHVIHPGAILGILGDGQLGKMIAIAAATMGYKVAVLGPGGRESPAGQVAYWTKAWGLNSSVSEELLDEFCRLVSVVMIEWENVPVELIERIEARQVPVRPGSKVLAVAQDRLLEKGFARKLGIEVPKHNPVDGSTSSRETDCALPAILKTRRNGYDGRGQVRIPAGGSVREAWDALGKVPCILEEVVDFVGEISVIVARSPWYTDSVGYGPFENVHESGILRTTYYPTQNPKIMLSSEVVARKAAIKIADTLAVHGLLAVEFFVTQDGTVLFNEMAPRPHNSGHLTIDCCDTSQFEQYVRAACNLPWGSVRFHSCGVMKNILGAEGEGQIQKGFWPGASVHLYGKDEPKLGRKMGHVTWKSASI